MPKDYTTMLVSSGLCSLLPSYLMVEPPVAFLLAAFLITWMIAETGITDHYTENAFLSSVGGGIGGCWNSIRSVGSKTSNGSESTGVIPFLKVVDAEMLAFSQGVTRRGSYASYLTNVSSRD